VSTCNQKYCNICDIYIQLNLRRLKVIIMANEQDIKYSKLAINNRELASIVGQLMVIANERVNVLVNMVDKYETDAQFKPSCERVLKTMAFLDQRYRKVYAEFVRLLAEIEQK